MKSKTKTLKMLNPAIASSHSRTSLKSFMEHPLIGVLYTEEKESSSG